VVGVCLAALVIADLQLGMTLFERWRLAVLDDVAVGIVAAFTRCHVLIASVATAATSIFISVSLTDSARQGDCVFLVRYGSWPALGRWPSCACCVRWRRDRATACHWRAAWRPRRRLWLAIRPWPAVWVVFGHPDRDLDPVADAEFGLDAGEVCLHG
jgi:hypothetical protein